MTKHLGALGLAWVSLALAGCWFDDEHIDCHEVCDAYDDCFGPIGEDRCHDRCEDLADQSDAFDEQLERCAACVENATCVETADFCDAECAGIVVP